MCNSTAHLCDSGLLWNVLCMVGGCIYGEYDHGLTSNSMV